MELVELISKETDMKMKENLMSTISSIVRGENLEAKRIFIRLDGLNLLRKLSENATQNLSRHKDTLTLYFNCEKD